MRRKKGTTVFEIILAVLILMIISNYSYPRYREMWRSGKVTSLKSDLKIFRETLEIYKMKVGTYPEKLYELTEKGYLSFGQGIELFGVKIASQKIDRDGDFIDPFGEKYIYNSETGEIKSSTNEMENY